MINHAITEFLLHSNYIEREYSDQAYNDAIRAWEYAYGKPFTIGVLLNTHRILLENINPGIAGKFRDCDVWIGRDRKKFISESIFLEELEELFHVMTFPQDSFSVSTARACHVKFEQIHPFEDGNGRVGRIFYNLHRLNLGLPVDIIHEGDEQMEYYKWFR